MLKSSYLSCNCHPPWVCEWTVDWSGVCSCLSAGIQISKTSSGSWLINLVEGFGWPNDPRSDEAGVSWTCADIKGLKVIAGQGLKHGNNNKHNNINMIFDGDLIALEGGKLRIYWTFAAEWWSSLLMMIEHISVCWPVFNQLPWQQDIRCFSYVHSCSKEEKAFVFESNTRHSLASHLKSCPEYWIHPTVIDAWFSGLFSVLCLPFLLPVLCIQLQPSTCVVIRAFSGAPPSRVTTPNTRNGNKHKSFLLNVMDLSELQGITKRKLCLCKSWL